MTAEASPRGPGGAREGGPPPRARGFLGVVPRGQQNLPGQHSAC